MMRAKANKVLQLALGGVLSLGLLTGCQSVDGAVSAAENEITEIRIANIIDESNPNAGVKNEEFRADLEEYLGISVLETEGASHIVGIEAMRSGAVDIMFVSPFTYFMAAEVVDVELLVSTSVSENAAANSTLFITQRGRDDINSVEDLEGKTFAFVNEASASGFLFPKYYLVSNLDLDQDRLLQSGYFFDAAIFSGSHDSSVMGVRFGDFDGAAVASGVMQPMIDAGVINEDDFKVIGYTEEIPNASYIIRADLPEDLIERIRNFFLNYDNPDFFEAVHSDPEVRFVEVDEEDYSHVRSLMDTLGIVSE